MDATYSSETSLAFQRTTLRYIPEDKTRNHRCDNLKILNSSYVEMAYIYHYVC